MFRLLIKGIIVYLPNVQKKYIIVLAGWCSQSVSTKCIENVYSWTAGNARNHSVPYKVYGCISWVIQGVIVWLTSARYIVALTGWYYHSVYTQCDSKVYYCVCWETQKIKVYIPIVQTRYIAVFAGWCEGSKYAYQVCRKGVWLFILVDIIIICLSIVQTIIQLCCWVMQVIIVCPPSVQTRCIAKLLGWDK